MTTLGFRNNNPGNLRPGTIKWSGEVMPDADHNLCRFDTMENGVRAMTKNLLAYYLNHDLTTVRGIISRWAPPTENDTAAYINAVSDQMGVGSNDQLDLLQPVVMQSLVRAIIHHENGADIPDDGSLLAGVDDAVKAA